MTAGAKAVIRDPLTGQITVVAGAIEAVRATCDYAESNGGVIDRVEFGEVDERRTDAAMVA